MDAVYILLPVHNRREITRGLIECLRRQTRPGFRLVLIDDGSTDGTAEMVRALVPDAAVVTGDGNWWWGGSLQQGLDWLAAHGAEADDWVLMMNDDATIDDDFIESGINALRSMPHTLLQATICSDTTREVLDAGMVYDDRSMRFRAARSPQEINCLTTNGLFARWGDLRKVGRFHPRLLPHYLSDYEYTIRAGRKGLTLAVSPDIRVWWNRETTGLRTFDEGNFIVFLQRYFSKKSALNPVYLTSFALLVGGIRHIPFHLVRIWGAALLLIARHAALAAKARFGAAGKRG